ncbi:MAG: hypothetical protein E7Z93_06180 [Cyanobacteria bacterium SIG32]|nr:hypothetical protein [Cyanobacteria bacterium SIG32]
MKEYNLEKIRDLRYGENPHQKASLFKGSEMVDYEVLFGQELSYDNILNIYELSRVLGEFYDVNAVGIIKHQTGCGIALGRTTEEAYNKAFDCDPVSAFYGTIGFTRSLDYDTAKHINSMGVRALIAPDFHPKALELLSENPSIKLVKVNTPLNDIRKMGLDEITVTPFGILIQEKNLSELNKDSFRVVTKVKPTTEQVEDAIFAWKVVKHARSDAAVVAKDFATLGISQSETSCASAIEEALKFACDGAKDAILATDGIIYSHDAIYAAAQARIGLIIQPGGSPKDRELIGLADKYGISMIMTGIRNQRH